MFLQGQMIHTVDTHTEGEATRIILGSLESGSAADMNAKLKLLRKQHDNIRTAILCEPRGHAELFGAFLLEPGDSSCDAGVIFADTTEYHGMCGHGTIGVVTAGIQLGMLPKKQLIKLDTPAGPVECDVEMDGDRVRSVSLGSVPSYVHTRDVVIDTKDHGQLHADVVYGGNFFAIVDTDQINLNVHRDNMSDLVNLGLEIRDLVNEKVKVSHPVNSAASHVELVEFSEKLGQNHYRNTVVLANGKFDRSPCGTGTAAKMSLLDLPIGATFQHDSVTDSTFTGLVEAKTTVDDRPATVSRITGSAWVTGIHQFIIDPTDPFPAGFSI